MKKAKKQTHPLCRPPKGATEVLRLKENGRWIKDDGEPGLAFVGLSGRITNTVTNEITAENVDASAWVASCNCKVHGECPASKALNKACDVYDGASLVRRPKVKP